MNSFGLNSAALNGSATRIIMGAALFVAAGTLSAEGTRTQSAEQVNLAGTSGFAATGVRYALGAAKSEGTSTAAADGAYATTAAATSEARFTALASHTEVWFQLASSLTAAGTIIQPGAATGASALVASASAVRTAGMEATAAIVAQFSGDPGVRRSGQTTVEREGYARSSWQASAAAAAVRTALAEASAGSVSDASAIGTHVQGGYAVSASTLSIQAIAAIDGARATFESAMTAKPTHTHGGEATAAAVSGAQADGAVTRPGEALPAAATFTATAAGRLALRGEATAFCGSSAVAEGRYGLRGEAAGTATFTCEAAPWVYRPASAELVAVSSMDATGTRVCMGEATVAIHFHLDLNPITNPTVAAPPGRRMRVAADDRRMRVPADNRSMKVT